MHPLDPQVSALMRAVGEEIILPRWRRLAAHEVDEKTPGDPVTIADRESEARLSAALAALLPGSSVIGEEAASADPALLDRVGDGQVWIIDPLDGTKNFAEGEGPFAIMVGLLRDGVSEAGWILSPQSGRMCHALRGGGAFVNGRPIRARRSEGLLPQAAIAHYFMPADRQADVLARARGKLEIIAIPRCAGEQYPRLALGQNDIALFERSYAWDHVPGALLLQEAGGKVARVDGTPYRADQLNGGMVGAASPQLWDEAVRILFG